MIFILHSWATFNFFYQQIQAINNPGKIYCAKIGGDEKVLGTAIHDIFPDIQLNKCEF